MQTALNLVANALALRADSHEENCRDCHTHAKNLKTNPSLLMRIHHNNGHKCTDNSCDIEAPHGHITNPLEKDDDKKHEHVHSETCNHDHSDDHKHEHSHDCGHDHSHDHKHDHDHSHDHHHHHDHKFPVWPLEDFIAHAPIPQWLREVSLNASFLTPAMVSSELLEKLPIPKLFKTWLAVTAMHATNRGKQKLPRLGLTYLISGAASAGSRSPLGAKLSRFLAAHHRLKGTVSGALTS